MDKTSLLWTTLGTLGLAALIIGGTVLLRSAPAREAAPAAIALAADDHAKGATSSPVLLVEYMDFECPSCAAFQPVVSQLADEYGDRVTFAVRHFPLNMHRNAGPAAYAAEAAGLQGAFFPMHDLLFQRQEAWAGKPDAEAIFEGYAAELGLNVARFRTDVASDAVRARVQRDADGGRALGINGTPTFFLNGRQLQNPSSIGAFRALIDAELAAQGAPTGTSTQP